MKKLISITAFALLTFVGNVKAEYAPFLTDWKAWAVAWYNPDLDGPNSTYLEKSASYCTLADETYMVNGHKCTLVKGVSDKNYMLFEDNRKVYLADEATGRNYLLYDFSVHKGDKVTFTYANDTSKSFELEVVAEEDVEIFPGELTLRRLTFEDGKIWIEGLGAQNVESFATIFPKPDYRRETEVHLTLYPWTRYMIWNWRYYIKGTDVGVSLNEPYGRPYVDPAKRYDLLGRELNGEPAVGSYYIEGGKLKKKI